MKKMKGKAVGTNKNGFTVIITVSWDKVDERIRLDYGPDGVCMGVRSSENWGEHGTAIHYSPRVTSQVIDGRCYSVELEYRAQDHAYLTDEVRKHVYWGTTRLRFHFDDGEPTLKKEDVRWEGNGSYGENLNGSPKKVVILREEPSKLKDVAGKVRAGQKQFKDKLSRLEKPPRCAISGEEMTALLDAAHVIPVADGGSDEVENGLLLRADIHRLFDAGVFRINPDGSLMLESDVGLSGNYRKSLENWKVSESAMQRIRISLKKKSDSNI